MKGLQQLSLQRSEIHLDNAVQKWTSELKVNHHWDPGGVDELSVIQQEQLHGFTFSWELCPFCQNHLASYRGEIILWLYSRKKRKSPLSWAACYKACPLLYS